MGVLSCCLHCHVACFFNVGSVQFCVSGTWFSSVFSVVAVKLAELHHFCPMIFLCLTCVTDVATALSILRQVIAMQRQVIAGPMGGMSRQGGLLSPWCAE